MYLVVLFSIVTREMIQEGCIMGIRNQFVCGNLIVEGGDVTTMEKLA
jgi:hypothetical protein